MTFKLKLTPQQLRTVAAVVAIAFVAYRKINLATLNRVALAAVVLTFALGTTSGIQKAARTVWFVLLAADLGNKFLLPAFGLSPLPL